MLLKIDLIDSWAEIEILIVAHNLPIEKYNFDWKQVPIWKFPQCTYHWLVWD